MAGKSTNARIKIPDEVLEKAMKEVFSGVAWRELSMVVVDEISRPKEGKYNNNTMYKKLRNFMIEKKVWDRYEKWTIDGKL
jgi:hypothetical protein